MNFHLQSIHIRPYVYILRYGPEWLGRLISIRCTSQNTETVTGGAGCARTPACTPGLGVVVGVGNNHHGLR